MRTYTPREIAALIDNAPTMRDKLIVRTLLSCGLRASELCALTVEDAMTEHVPRESLRLRVHKNMAKHNGPQSVPLPQSLGIALALYAGNRRPSSPLFPSRTGEHLTANGLGRMWRKLCARAGVEHGRLHSTRGTFITRCLDNGTPIHVVRDLARHKSIATTNIYAVSTPSAMAKAAAAVEV